MANVRRDAIRDSLIKSGWGQHAADISSLAASPLEEGIIPNSKAFYDLAKLMSSHYCQIANSLTESEAVREAEKILRELQKTAESNEEVFYSVIYRPYLTVGEEQTIALKEELLSPLSDKEIMSDSLLTKTSEEVVIKERSRLQSLTRNSKVILFMVMVIAALAGYSIWTTSAASSSHSRGEKWRQRGLALQSQLDRAEATILERTSSLNQTRSQVNTASHTLAEARRSLSSSESDVKLLQKRQRQLANDKAQLEDERLFLNKQKQTLATVAGLLLTCNHELIGFTNAVINNDYAWLNTYSDTVVSDCQAAQAAAGNL
jgi:hypothetical protein